MSKLFHLATCLQHVCGLAIHALFWVTCVAVSAQQPPASTPPATPELDAKTAPATAQPAQQERSALNLLGQVNAEGGEGRRNENVQVNLVDNNAARDLNRRVGITATLVEEFRPALGYFATEYGGAPRASIQAAPQSGKGVHGNLYWGHNNSLLSARSFFQVGGVKPARTNQYGGGLGTGLWKNSYLTILGSREQNTGNVNGNVLIPLPSERTPLTSDPKLKSLIQKMIDGYPNAVPNRTDVAARSYNSNATQVIHTDTATGQITQRMRVRETLVARYAYTAQRVDAFQFIRGANPNSRNLSHAARLSWNRALTPRTILEATVGFDRQNTILLPTQDAPVTALVTGLSTLGPPPTFPLDRAQNRFRYGGSLSRQFTKHSLSVGLSAARFQYNGYEDETSRGIFQYRDDFGRTGIENFRYGTPSTYTIALGTSYRAFRNWEMVAYAGDRWVVNKSLTLNYTLRYEPVTRPLDVTGRSKPLFNSDWNNVSGTAGFAYRWKGSVLRGSFGAIYGQIFPATYGIDRWNKPYNARLSVAAPNLVNPLEGFDLAHLDPRTPTNSFGVSPDLATPYSYPYNFSWERDVAKGWKLQLGYVGSRTHKLFAAYILNRARPVNGLAFNTSTLNQRRADPTRLEYAYVNNAGRAYYDAGRATLTAPRWHRLNLNASYWFSKSIDLGTDYNATGASLESRRSAAQSESESHRDMKALSAFDQPHALLVQATYDVPRIMGAGWVSRATRNWSVTVISLIKSGTPFIVDSGSDGPGFGNVDGTVGDRVMLLDPTVLGRTIGNPDTSQQLLPRSVFRFIRAPEEMSGNLGRNVFRKGKIANFNAAVTRTWALRGDWQVNLRAESINLLNTPQFAEPGASLTQPNFGQITNTLNDGRTFRFQLRLAW